MRITKKKAVAVVAATATIALGATGAYAYFTQTGSGGGTASVGTTTGWDVNIGARDTSVGVPALFPDDSFQRYPVVVTNTSDGGVQLRSLAVSLDASGGGFILIADGPDADTEPDPVAGCLASWFEAGLVGAPTVPTGVNTPSGGTIEFDVDITMPTNNDDNQDACQGASPLFTVTAG